jgi:hypothetical protein
VYTQELDEHTTNTTPRGQSVRAGKAVHPARTKAETSSSQSEPLLSIHGSPKWLHGLRKDLGEYVKRPYRMLSPKTWGFKPPKSPGIETQPRSITKLGFQLKSLYRRPHPVFQESRSSTKMHKTSIHDPHKQNRTQMLQNRQIKPHMKIPQKTQKSLKPREEIDTIMNASIQPEISFSTK